MGPESMILRELAQSQGLDRLGERFQAGCQEIPRISSARVSLARELKRIIQRGRRYI